MMRFGLIGLGGIGDVRKQALEVSTECKLTAAFDLDSALLARLPGHVTVFKDAEQLLQSDACDAVIISTPTHFHKDLALTALSSWKNQWPARSRSVSRWLKRPSVVGRS